MTNRVSGLPSDRTEGHITIMYVSAYSAKLGFACTGSSASYPIPPGSDQLAHLRHRRLGHTAKPGGSNGAAGASLSGLFPVSASGTLNVGVGCAGKSGGTGTSGASTEAGGAGGFGYYAGGAGGRTTKVATDTNA